MTDVLLPHEALRARAIGDPANHPLVVPKPRAHPRAELGENRSRCSRQTFFLLADRWRWSIQNSIVALIADGLGNDVSMDGTDSRLIVPWSHITVGVEERLDVAKDFRSQSMFNLTTARRA